MTSPNAQPQRPRFRIVVALFALALALRLGYLTLVWTGPLGNADSPAYRELAITLLHGEPYHTAESAGPGGFPSDLQRPPGYPAFLALVNSSGDISYRRTALVQCALGSLFVVLVTYLVGIINPRLGALAGLFCATDWVTIVHTPMLIAETAFSFSLGTAVMLWLVYFKNTRAYLSLAAGTFLGIAALIKPAAQLVALAFLISWWFHTRRNWWGLIFLFAFAACLVPWMARNESKYGVLTISEIGTADLYFYTAQGSLGTYSFSDLAGGERTADVIRLDSVWRAQSLDVRDRASRMRHDALKIIVAHWPAVLRQAAFGLARTSIGTAAVTASDSMNPPPGYISRLCLVVLPLFQIGVLWLFAIYGAWHGGPLNVATRILLSVSALCLLFPAASPLAQSRFRVPVVPELSVLASAGILKQRSLREKSWTPI